MQNKFKYFPFSYPYGYLALFILLLCLIPSKAVAKPLDQDFQGWGLVILSVPVSPKTSVQVSLQHRVNQNFSKADRSFVEGGVLYQLTPFLSLGQGYTWRGKYQPEFFQENRPWQQVQLQKTFRKLTVIERLRLEERFIESAGHMVIRGRALTQLTYPISKSGRWTVLVFDETFWVLNDPRSSQQPGFEQNRIFGGLKYQFNKHCSLEGGYMLQYYAPNGAPGRTTNHVFLNTLRVSL